MKEIANKMTDSRYNLLPFNEKIEMIRSEGKFIEGLELNDYDLFLYNLDGQLIEVYFSIEKNRIEKIRVLNDPDWLKLYTIEPEPNIELA